MMDFYMVVLLLGVFAMLAGFLAWCARTVDGKGGEGR